MPGPEEERLLTPQFLAVTAATAAYFLAYGAITPVLPRFVTSDLGLGNFEVGLVVGIFSVSAILTRPLAGRLGNIAGRRWLMLAGSLLAAISIASYGTASGLWMLLGLRLITGVAEGFFYTGATTLVSDLAPEHRRGEAISLFSVAIWIGNGLGPAVGQVTYRAAGANASFLLAAAFSGLALVLSLAVPQMRVPHVEGEARPPLIGRQGLAPGFVLALSIAGTTAFNAYVPLYADHLHLGQVEFVFILYAVIVLGVRIFFARLPDQWGPMRTGTAATSTLAGGFLLIAATGSIWGLYAGTVLIAIGNSLIFPALMAMALHGLRPRDRSSTISTFSAFFDVSSGFGGISLGAVAALGGIRWAFVGGAAYAAGGLAMLRTSIARRLDDRAEATDITEE
jgi:MFS family permease